MAVESLLEFGPFQFRVCAGVYKLSGLLYFVFRC